MSLRVGGVLPLSLIAIGSVFNFLAKYNVRVLSIRNI